MILTALAASLLLTTLICIVIVYRFYRRLSSSLSAFITSPDEKTASPLANFVDNLAFVFSQRLVLQFKTTFMGMNSVDAKKERAEAGQLALDKSPLLGTIAQFIPGIGKRLAKNPVAVELISSLLNKAGGNGHKEVASSPAGDNPFKY